MTWVAISWGLVFCATAVFAADIPGVVNSSSERYATVVTDSDLLPVPGDKVEIFFNLPGSNDEISVASGHVYEITGANIMVEIDNATGTIAKHQLVRITSPNPRKKSELVTVPPAPEPSAAIAEQSPTQTAESAIASPPSAPSPATPPATIVEETATAKGAVERSSDRPGAGYLTRARTQYSAGDVKSAIATLTAGIAAAPSDADLYLARANIHMINKNARATIADANKALELKASKMDFAYLCRGIAKVDLHDYRGAIADMDRALKINPREAAAYTVRASCKVQLGDYRGALADCNKAVELQPDMPETYYQRGYAYKNLGDPSAALNDFQQAVRLKSSFAADLNREIAQLQAKGARSESQRTDLVNPAQKILGSWKGGRHVTQYSADGSFVTDPDLVPDPPRGQWRIEGDRLIEFFPGANQTVTRRILSLTEAELVTRNERGQTFRENRVSR